MQVDNLFGGSGDDKIWMVNPNQRHMDILDSKNYGSGNDGNDWLYGTDGNDTLWGDFIDAMPGVLDANDTIGGDDWLQGFKGDDHIHGGYGNDKLEGGEGNDLLYGEFGDDKIFGGDGVDIIFGDDKTMDYPGNLDDWDLGL